MVHFEEIHDLPNPILPMISRGVEGYTSKYMIRRRNKTGLLLEHEHAVGAAAAE